MRATIWSNLPSALAWLFCTAPGFLAILRGDFGGSQAAIWLWAAILFGTAFGAHVWLMAAAHDRRLVLAIAAVQSITAFTMVVSGFGIARYTAAVGLVIVAEHVVRVLSRRSALLWAGAQSALLAVAFWWLDGWVGGLSGGGTYAGMHWLAVGRALLTRAEQMARDELTRTNAELRATRGLLAESSRAAERLRISRDLHDGLGHHLTALILQLDVASRQAANPAADHIREAHALARLLLSDVRDAVSSLRGSGRVNVADLIRPLISDISQPCVHLDMEECLYLDNPAHAHTILRCIQETLTNAIRHGQAHNLWIRVEDRSGGLDLQARDDGRGVARLKLGHGLKGMQERFEECAGTVQFSTSPGHGFELHAFLPRREVAL